MSGATGSAVHVVVMGVSGSGKSAVAEAVGRALGSEVIEGDALHPADNVAKMAAGVPLTDADREPWLRDLAALTADRHAAGRSTVLACSALRRAYRDVLRSGVPVGASFVVHLAVSASTAMDRMAGRAGHFMPTALAGSQFAALEPLDADEPGITVDAERPLPEVVAAALAGIAAWRDHGPAILAREVR